jgi:glycosyltransferase involved in cell wall biosynthesis
VRSTAAPALSVIVPCWNAGATIERALGSILDDRSVALECIVVDDRSTDDTVARVAAVAATDERVILLRQPVNAGVSAARNRGLATARAQWLAFLDADDRFLPGGLAALMGRTSGSDVLAVVGQRIQDDGTRRWISQGYDNPDIRQPGRKSLAANPGLLYYAAIHGKVFHRSLLDDLCFEGRVLGDQPWTIGALLRAADRIDLIDTDVYEWFRPPPDRDVEGITAGIKRSTIRAVAMVERAPLVFAAVSTKIDRWIPDEATRWALKGAYLERLVRSDIGVAMRQAVDRHDPASERLFIAIARFLEVVPERLLADRPIVVERLARPPVRHWASLDRPARRAYWSMVRPLLRVDPRLGARIAWRPEERPIFAIARRFDGPTGEGVTSGLLWLGSWMFGRFAA